MDSSLWLQLENKVRALIKDLLEPTVRRVTESSKQLEKVTKQQNSVVFKLEDVDIAVMNIGKRLLLLDEFAKRILEFEGSQAIMESRFNKDREELRSGVSLFSQKLDSLQENFEVIERQREQIKTELANANQSILANKYELEEKISKINSQHREFIIELENKFLLLDVANNQVIKNVEKFSGELIKVDSSVTKVERNIFENSEKVKSVTKKLEKVSARSKKEVEKVMSMALSNSADVRECLREIKRIDFEIESDESALLNEIRMTEPLYAALQDLKVLKQLAIYDINRLERLNKAKASELANRIIERTLKKAQEIIDTPLPPEPILRLKSASTTSSKRLRRTRRKQLKKQVALNISQALKGLSTKNSIVPEHSDKPSLSNILNLSQNLQPSLRPVELTVEPPLISKPYESNKEISLSESKPKSSSKNLSKAGSGVKIQESSGFTTALKEAIEKANDANFEYSDNFSEESSDDSQDFIDFTPMIEQVRLQLQSENQSIYNELKSLITSVQDSATSELISAKNDLHHIITSIKSNHENYNANMQRTIQEIEVLTQQAIYECNAASAQRKRDFNDNTSKFKSFSASIESCNKYSALLAENIESLSKSIECITNFCKISTALQSQDEQDRESIFLMGSRPKRQKPVVTIDKRCLSCAGQSSSVIAAFKVACLAYEPSLVQFQSRKFTRKELLKLQSAALPQQEQSPDPELSDETREGQNRLIMTSRQWRPLSVPPSRFSTLTSPNLRTPDTENLPLLRKSLNL